jgi:hypothetical protein
MGEAVALVGIALLAMIMLGLAVMGATWRRIQLRNEVSPRQRLHPPTHWLASPSSCGRLHRRLRAAVAALHLVLPLPRRRRRRHHEPSALEDLAREIEAQAVALDRDLIVVDRLRGPNAVVARRALAQQVVTIEVLAHRVTAAARAAERVAGSPPPPEALAAVATRLDLLEAARVELAQITTAPGWSTARTFTDAPSG